MVFSVGGWLGFRWVGWVWLVGWWVGLVGWFVGWLVGSWGDLPHPFFRGVPWIMKLGHQLGRIPHQQEATLKASKKKQQKNCFFGNPLLLEMNHGSLKWDPLFFFKGGMNT